MNTIELLLEFLFLLVANGTIFCLRLVGWFLTEFLPRLHLAPIYACEITLELLCIIADHYWPPPPPPPPADYEIWPDDCIPPPSWTDPKNHDIAPLWYLRELERRKAKSAPAPAPAPQRPSVPLRHRLYELFTALLAAFMAIFVGFGHLFMALRRSPSASATTSQPVTGDAGQLLLGAWSSDSLTKLHDIIEDQELEGPVPPEFSKLQVSIEAVLKGRGVEV
ncbi:hypothetical protein BDV96DRAFT_650480 [Lophiotrema nucula]|uniref:Uncharacterized protein n=1 Tax=Lophiotrema nucula TaxID=690887 RepID=A0A6A5YUI9_9PLEO|nr:hypothetical protein BDV96DRAFT_650480 [Lophiotrema nucula]